MFYLQTPKVWYLKIPSSVRYTSYPTLLGIFKYQSMFSILHSLAIKFIKLGWLIYPHRVNGILSQHVIHFLKRESLFFQGWPL